MSNGDSLDGFVFPPFIPTASARPPQAPPAAPQPSVQEPASEPAPAVEAAGRLTMPWDLETPIVRQDDAPPAAALDAEDDEEDLPWLEVPAPREAEAPAAEAPSAPAGDDAFPEWMSWDQRDETAAEAEARDSVAPIAGLEDFVPVDELGGFVAPRPAVEWSEAEPVEPAASAEPAPGFDAAPESEPFTEGGFEASATEAVPAVDAWLPAADAEPAQDAWFTSAEAEPARDAWSPAADAAPAQDAWSSAADAEPAQDAWSSSTDAEPARDAWSLAAPEAAEPPSVYDAPASSFEESPAAAEPSFEVSVDDAGTLSVEPAADPQPFVADDEAVMAAEPEPSAADAEPVTAAEPDPFTAASVAEAEAAVPAEPLGAESPFDDVAARLEAIARMLRERPDELLAGGSSDPLALLVTGYVMGYTARGGR
jgi:hypothetical protein